MINTYCVLGIKVRGIAEFKYRIIRGNREPQRSEPTSDRVFDVLSPGRFREWHLECCELVG